MSHLLDQPVHSPRLLLRAHTPKDAPLIVELDADPEVRRYVDSPTAPTLEHITNNVFPRWQEFRDNTPGHGYWIAETREPQAFIGWFHLRAPRHGTPERLGDLELGYRLLRAAWGKGYATEGSLAMLSHGFERLDPPRIIAAALADNVASIAVMKKIGMTLDTEWMYKDSIRAVTYAIERAQWQSGLKK
jgi:RimJ/RimL family protein N-acetyltransferase